MRRTLITAVLVCFAGPALASQCPSLWQQINDKMEGTHAPKVDSAKLEELRQKGEAFHHAGKHAASIAALKQALALLK